MGQHRSSNLGKFFEFINSLIRLFFYFANNRPKVAASVGGQELCIISYIFNIPCISFNDDPGHGIVFKLTSKTATELVLPEVINHKSDKLVAYSSYKELAHLDSSLFTPNEEVLSNYGLEKYSYIIFREQDSVSMVYRNTSVGDFKNVITQLDSSKLKFVFSLENKTNIDFYKKRGIVLEEPVRDFHSLVAFARLVVTTGDTLARESCLLGTPAIYSGGRDMPVNRELINLGFIRKIDDISKIYNFLNLMIDEKYRIIFKKNIKAYIDDLENTNEVITNCITRRLV